MYELFILWDAYGFFIVEKLCREDYISQREIIVPIAVGGFLIFLVTILILAYIGAFIKRKVKERAVNYTRM